MKLHGGTISVQSEGIPGQGCIFSVCIPTAPRPSATAMDINSGDVELGLRGAATVTRQSMGDSSFVPPPIESGPSALDRSSNGAVNPQSSNEITTTEDASRDTLADTVKSRALVVDDSALNRKMLARYLATIFDDILTAANGAEAVDLVKKYCEDGSKAEDSPIDIIFMDNVMPILNGLDATRSLRQLGYTNPIVGITGNSLPEQIKEFIDYGATTVVKKPVELDDLVVLIRGEEELMKLLYLYYAVLIDDRVFLMCSYCRGDGR